MNKVMSALSSLKLCVLFKEQPEVLERGWDEGDGEVGGRRRIWRETGITNWSKGFVSTKIRPETVKQWYSCLHV
ncbi:hypothetical protein HanPSC8_Chr09g0401371 [Helianthus annuus]|nr:hypothetical protein HanPSC8_Chr09g0401371 [Helianthus annuus]